MPERIFAQRRALGCYALRVFTFYRKFVNNLRIRVKISKIITLFFKKASIYVRSIKNLNFFKNFFQDLKNFAKKIGIII